MEDLPKKFATWLGLLAAGARGDQTRIARLTGLSQPSVSRILKAGPGSDLRLSTLSRTADSLSLRPWQLLRYIEREEIPEELLDTLARSDATVND